MLPRRHPLNGLWAITEQGLQLVLSIWSREELFAEVLRQARADRGDAPLRNARRPQAVQDGVAVIDVCGPLCRYADSFTEVSGASSYASLQRDLGQAEADPAVGSILLRIDSPGGEANGCEAQAARIHAARKPILAYADGTCASAAYWLGSGARKLWAAPTAFVGSIGVRQVLMDDAEAQAESGRRRIEIVSSQSPGKRGSPVDDAVRARVQQTADDLADLFVGAVALHRGVSAERVLADFGQGDVLIAGKALAAGMVDQVASFEEALAHAKTMGAAPQQRQKQTAGRQALARRTTTMQRTLEQRLEALAAMESLQADGEARQELRALVPLAKQQAEDLFAARSQATDAAARAEKAEYETLVREAKEPRRDAAGKVLGGPKITGPAHEENVRKHFTTTVDLRKYLAVADEAAVLNPARPATTTSGASPALQNAVASAMGYPTTNAGGGAR